MIRKSKKQNEQGFTFAEVMIVVAIFGILSAIALPNFIRSLPEKRLKNATRNLYADLQKARLQAVKENGSVTVTFNTDPAVRTYSYPGEGGQPVIVEFADNNPDDTDDYQDVVYGCGITNQDWRDPAVNIPPLGVTGNVTFNNLGESSNGEMDIYLQSQNDNTVCFAVNVSRFGVVKIWRYDSGSGWK
ncbi:MAG: prepilin-type N-terminal cleavage/methylation domain-containing protein [Candidatus Electrothrix sp. AUS4]|nr:prepilin-type N-terminal cleavage/methylation domain-containing protein [Candidatus Electrothrix sp. AUS4]